MKKDQTKSVLDKYIIKKPEAQKIPLGRNLQAEINKIRGVNLALREKNIAPEELARLKREVESLLSLLQMMGE